MQETINPAIVIPIVLVCFVVAMVLVAQFTKERMQQKLQDVRADLKSSAQHEERYRGMYNSSLTEVRALKEQLIRVSDAKVTMNNKLVAIRNALSTMPLTQVILFITEKTEGFTKSQDLQDPPIKRGAHTLFIDGNGDAQVKSQQL